MVYTKQNVLALLDDRKFNSRRLGGLKEININPDSWQYLGMVDSQAQFRHITGPITIAKPKYQVGDECYVAEGYQIETTKGTKVFHVKGIYLSDKQEFNIELTYDEWKKWTERKHKYRPTPGRFMYKSLARIFYKITEVRVERLQDISEENAIAEGVRDVVTCGMGGWKYYVDLSKKHMKIVQDTTVCKTARKSFGTLWNSIHGDGAWELNPYIFVYCWDKIKIGE